MCALFGELAQNENEVKNLWIRARLRKYSPELPKNKILSSFMP